MATYQWKSDLVIESGGYQGEPKGVIPASTGWVTSDVDQPGQLTAVYWYTDSDHLSQDPNVNASKVSVSIEQSWSAQVDTLNNLIIDIQTQIFSIERVLSGDAGSTTRDIEIRKSSGDTALWTIDQDPLSSHTMLSTPVTTGIYTLTLAPGEGIEQSSIWYRSHVHGYPWTETYTDQLGMGVRFKNTLPVATTYTLNYNANGGSGAPAAQTAQTNVGSTSFTVSSTVPTWGDFIFLGWSTRQVDEGQPSDVEYRAGDTITLQEASPTMTLYAVWEKSYIPGKTWNGTKWLSHNRPINGHARLFNGSTWSADMKTINGPTGTGNPPLIKHTDGWKNQRKIGDNS